MAITPSSRKILCGNEFYKTNHSKIFRILQKVIFAEMTFIRPITPFSNTFYKKMFRFLENDRYKPNHFISAICAKGHFRGFDFYNNKFSKLERK